MSAMTIDNAVSLFDGIGGFPLAMARNGIQTVASVEIDKRCRDLTAKHPWIDLQFADVKEVNGEQLRTAGFEPETGILTAGWPCQGNSVAGRRGGMADPRSGLWSEVVRLLRETRPRWFLGENVPGILSIHGGRDFAIVKESLEELGYGVAWRVLDAQYFGVPQRRRRVFIVGCLGDGSGPAEVLFEPEGCDGNSEAGGEAGPKASAGTGDSAKEDSRVLDGYSLKADDTDTAFTISTDVHHNRNVVCVTGPVTHTLCAEGADASEDGSGRGTPIVTSTLQGGGKRGYRVDAESAAGNQLVVSVAENQRAELTESPVARSVTTGGGKPGQGYPAVRSGMDVRRLTPRECERLQGFPDDWTAGQSDSARYRQLGNAVAVPVVEWVIKRMVSTCQR